MKDYLILSLSFICYSFLISIAFLKRGFLKRNSKLYKGSSFLGKLFFKTPINILNNKHTKREPILDLKKKENSEPITEFLISNFDLKYEKYTPKFREKNTWQHRVKKNA